MLEISDDIQNVESWDPGSGGAVPPGIYEVVIDSVEVKQAGSGFPNLSLKCKVVAGEHLGGTVFANRSLHPNALPYFRGLLDMLNCYATGKAIDESRLVGRFMKVQVVEYDKNDGSKGVKADKQFKSDINFGKNTELDISGGHANVAPGVKAAPAPAQRPAATAVRPGNGNGNNGRAATAAQPKPSAAPAAKPNGDEDLPF